ncbi:50S ribosomal protein L25/general stress protein Ctc [Wandonia haliotis]|uniref:Large ribosomal subunit protein bL25 n=1 Tax=Wandonia haliotis TaxID=574963 RepID=A0ABN1MLS9_9FLAO
MKVVSLSGSPRENVGKKDAKALRSAGLVPCVLYGSGEQVHFSAEAVQVDKLIYTPEVYKVDLDINGRKSQAIIQEVQQNPLTDDIIHVDFLELDENKPVKISLPVRIKGIAPGVTSGGKLQQVFRKLKLAGLPKDMPADITLDISKLEIGDAIRVKHVEIPGVQLLDPANAVVVSVKMARGAKKKSAEEEAEAEG